ncbi:50S ribosomal protein L10 [Wenzhouxiangella sp. XN79A]|uniref:50S ribosomal protein L10 n=1 Tax=Wenzhouxiangella sp. XN79A TaxID=2724193 RepID=UPI00144AE7AF|nr:50S ribosomal protein L10 [Wenzhouxiangella sp. XN79A]NKI33786.1 50S ribosomal protein L10 [Wenzhouxiangella sp. XN79A]
MALSLEQKKAVVAEVALVAQSAHSAVAAEYRGITVEKMTEMRAKARSEGVYLKVAKNTLVKRAVEGTEFECMAEELTGPLLFAFSIEDPGAAARLIKDFAKNDDKLVVRLVAMGATLYQASEIERLAKMPTRDQAISMLMGVMKAPIEKLARTLAEPHAKLVRTVAAVRDSKQAA